MAFTPERTSVFNRVFVGAETTPGTQVSATTELKSISISPKLEINTNIFRPQGSLVDTLVSVGKDYTVGSYESQPCYEELSYILGSAIDTPAGTTYILDTTAENTPKTYSLECGASGAGKAIKVPGLIFTGFTLNATPAEIKMNGDILGWTMDTSGTVSNGTTATSALTPLLPKHLTVSIDSVTQTRWFSVELSFTGHWVPVFALGSSSMVNYVETAPELKLKIVMEMNSQAQTILSRLRADNATKIAILDFDDGTNQAKFSIGTKVSSIQEFSDSDGVYAIAIELTGVYDSTLTTALKVEL